jgi:(p)ppGpp synthase/HD superfamily hydrolase
VEMTANAMAQLATVQNAIVKKTLNNLKNHAVVARITILVTSRNKIKFSVFRKICFIKAYFSNYNGFDLFTKTI